MCFTPWWEEQPKRLEWEKAWLEHEGYDFEETGRDAANGTLSLRVRYPKDDMVLPLDVTFPSFFPDARVEVRCADLSLDHHQNPFTHELCLLGRSTALWDPSTSLASFLKNQMPELLRTGTATALSAAPSPGNPREDPQAEPATAFFPFLPHSELLIDERAATTGHSSGRLTAGVKMQMIDGEASIRGIISSLDGTPLWTPPRETLERLWSFDCPVSGRWYELSVLPRGRNAEQFLSDAAGEHAEVGRHFSQFRFGAYSYELLVFRIPSEIGHRTGGWEWTAVLRRTRKQGGRKGREVRMNFVKVETFGRDLLHQRAPELAGLATRCVAVVGLGCVGAPCAIELARGGLGELRLLDPDLVDASTIIRWPLGVPAVGYGKIQSLGGFIKQQFPFSDVKIQGARIGAVPANGGISRERLKDFLAGAHLVLDATAEMGVSSILSHAAGELNIPLVTVSSTHGGWGGTVVTYEPGKSGCYDCFLSHVNQGTIPAAPESGAPRIQTTGCAETTYAAANFDTGEVALAAVRTAVSLLTAGSANAYPTVPHGVAILKLREPDGTPCLPAWQRFDLTVHPECERH